MTLTIELTDEQARRVREAQSKGADFDRAIQSAIEARLKELDEDEKRRVSAIAYFNEQLKNALTDPEEIREADEDTQELLRGLNANRLATGERPLFPE